MSVLNNSLSLVVPRRRWIWSGRILALRRPQHQHPHLWGEQDFCVLSTWPTRWRQPSSSSSTACLATSGRCSTGATRWHLKPSLHAIDCSHSSIINSLCLWTWTMNVHISQRTHNLHSNQRFANKKHCKKKWSYFRVTEFSPLAAASPTCMVWCSPGIRHFLTSRWSPLSYILSLPIKQLVYNEPTSAQQLNTRVGQV